jgi:CRP-like cAMP-binding protein
MRNLFKRSYSEKERQLFLLLSKNQIFEKLNEDELSRLIPHLVLRSYKSNEVVFFSGDPSHAYYIVKSGMVSLSLELKNGFEKLITIRKGQGFGDNCVMERSTRLYTAIVSTEEAEIYILPQPNILEVMNSNANIREKIMAAFAEKYNKYTEELFKTYKKAFGFFELNQVYKSL